MERMYNVTLRGVRIFAHSQNLMHCGTSAFVHNCIYIYIYIYIYTHILECRYVLILHLFEGLVIYMSKLNGQC
jgi:hypothetical protein